MIYKKSAVSPQFELELMDNIDVSQGTTSDLNFLLFDNTIPQVCSQVSLHLFFSV